MSDGSGERSAIEANLTISVVINTCDRCDALRELIRSLDSQTFPWFEVVVVVGPTTDRSSAMLEEDFGDSVTVVDCPRFNLSVSRNLGIAHAAGDVLAFIDDDAQPCPTWLAQLASAYLDPAVAGVGGRTYNVLQGAGELQFLRGMFSVLAEQEDVRVCDRPPMKSAVSQEHWFPRLHGTNMSYRRQALLAVGGFDERYEYLFDDADIAARLARSGSRLQHLSHASVYHRPGLGRNRGGHPYDLNWYCWSRSAIYFAIKNGTPAVGVSKSLAAALRIASTFRAQVDELRVRGDMPKDLHRRARSMLRRGLVKGLHQGLFARRSLPHRLDVTTRDFKPFQARKSSSRACPSGIEVRSKSEEQRMNDRPLRVCLLSVGYPPHDTHGVSRSTHTLARGLVELGHEVHVVTSGDRHRLVLEDGVHLHQVNGRAEDRYRMFTSAGYTNLSHWLDHSHAVFDRVRALQEDHEIQIVDSPLWNLDGLVTAVAGAIPVAVRVVTAMKQIAAVHDSETAETRLLADLEREFLTLASAVISNSRGTVLSLSDVYGIDIERTPHHLVPYGIVPVADRDVPEATSSRDGEVTVLFVGRLEGRKGILDLFEAIPRVLREAPETRFQIVGADNSLEDGFRAVRRMDYASFFRKSHPTCVDRVQFLGFVGEERLQKLYRGCDVFVAPSLYESFGLVFLEAMNYARPVVGCRSGGPEDIIVDSETGFLVPPQDPRALADALVRLVRSPEERADLGGAGRRRLLDRYSHTAMAEGFVDAYRTVLAAGEASPEQASEVTGGERRGGPA